MPSGSACRRRLPGLLVALVAAHIPGPAGGEVFHSRETALKLAFPGADRVEARDLVLTTEEAGRVADLAGVTVESRLVTAYEGRAAGQVLGWAFLDTHTVRTLPETLLLVVDPRGNVRQARLLAFHEPPEYAPPARWLARWEGEALDARLAVGRDVDGITGATLTAHAFTGAVRRLLAVARLKLVAAPPEDPSHDLSATPTREQDGASRVPGTGAGAPGRGPGAALPEGRKAPVPPPGRSEGARP